MKNKKHYSIGKDQGVRWFVSHFKALVGSKKLVEIYDNWKEKEWNGK